MPVKAVHRLRMPLRHSVFSLYTADVPVVMHDSKSRCDKPKLDFEL